MSEFEIYRILAQSRPSGTGATTSYTKSTKSISTIAGIVVCNTTGSAVNYSIYICKNGTTYDQTTAIAYATPMNPNDSLFVELPFTLDTTNGSIGVQSSTGNALNFTIIGKLREIT